MKCPPVPFFMLLALAISVFGCASQAQPGDKDYFPPPALEKYKELGLMYKDSLGSTIYKCDKGGSTVYRVGGSGGYSGVNYYYDETGVLLGTYFWDDTPLPSDPSRPVKLEESKCTLAKSSKRIGG